MSRILIVDDVPAVCEAISTVLKGQGYDTISAVNGAEAVELARTANPSLILLDVDMPDMDGLAVLKAMRTRVATAFIPVIMLTSMGDPNLVTTAVSLGAVDYVVKTRLSMTRLLAKIRKYVPQLHAA